MGPRYLRDYAKLAKAVTTLPFSRVYPTATLVLMVYRDGAMGQFPRLGMGCDGC